MHIVADLVQDLEASVETGNVQEATPLALYEEESTELAQFDALFAEDSEHVGEAGTNSSDIIDAVEYDIHLARFQSSMNSHH